jgi:hypothetical protein
VTRSDRRLAPPDHHNTRLAPTLMRDNSTTMAPIDDAIEDYKSQEPGEQLSYTKVAEKHGIPRCTLARRCKGSQVSMGVHNLNKQKLSPQQELELVDYIKGLSKRGLPPTREMTRRFASEIGNCHIGNGWVGRFLRNKHHLTSRWTKGMDAVRHKADSEANYKLYFDLLH